MKTYRPTILIAIPLFAMLTSAWAEGNSPGPDLLVLNGSIHTMDEARPKAEAVAVFGNRIAAVGSTADLRPLAGPGTRVIDAAGHTVLPGFNDAHVHWLGGGFSIANVDLRDAATPAELARRLAEHAKKLPKGRWILGGNWDHENWPGTPLPTKDMIDTVTPEHPVLVNRLDGHMALANSLALKIANVTKDTEDVDGGMIVRDAQGEPTGVLKDAAMAYVEKVVPARSWDEKLAAARAATEHAARLGVTSVQDMSAEDDVGLYQYQLARGELKTRIYCSRSIVSWEVLGRTGVRAPFGSDWLRIGGLKGFADGSLGSTTAYFFEPYVDAPDTRGLLFDQMFPEGIMLRRVTEADKLGLHVMIHAIGDAANHRILDIYQHVAAQNGPRDRRFRIEHAQHLRPDEIRQFAAQKVIASMQPYHCADDGRWCEKRIGPERAKGTYAFRALLDAGVMLAFGSDWPVAPLNPMPTLKAAVTRQTLDGKHPGGWVPEQKITLEEAIRAYTVGSAYAEFQENMKGSLTPGKLADLVVLDRDIFTVNPAELDQAKVRLTVVDGRIAYEAKLAFQYQSGDIRVSMPTADEPRVKQFGPGSLRLAAKYLEDGAVSWVREKSCVNCHTTGPYLAERSAWTKPFGKPNAEVLADFVASVPKEVTPVKETETNGHKHFPGTFYSVWRSLGLAEWDRHLNGTTTEPTDRSLRDMFERQSENGAFVSHGEVEIPHITTDFELTLQATRAICAAPGWLAGLKDDALLARVAKLKEWLRSSAPRNDFDRILKLQLAHYLPELVPQPEREAALALLSSKQHSDGGWSTRDMSPINDWHFEMSPTVLNLIRNLPDADRPESDAYMTALAIVLFRQSNVPAADTRIQRGLAWLRREQRASGRWWMHSLYRGNYHYITYIATAQALKAFDLCGALPAPATN